MTDRRITEHLSETDLLFVEAVIILECRMPDRIVIRRISLNQNFAGLIASSCPSCCLREQLEGSLSAPVIAGIQRHIRQQHADQSHSREIMPFDDHLRPDQDLRFPVRKCRQHRTVSLFASCCVCIHAENSGIRKKCLKLIFDLLRSDRYPADML